MAQQESIVRRVFFSIYSYTIIYALFGVLSLSYHACFNSSLSTLEKRYHFSSSTGGLIMITDNIATVLTNLFIGHFGNTAHKPRWMSIGCIVTGLSVMVTALPYFIYGPAQENELELVANMSLAMKFKNNGDQMCMAETQKEDCSEMSATGTMTKVAVACFALSNFFRGFGTSIYFTYGTPYLDDNVSKAKMPTFFAFIFAARIFGAPIGFYLSSLALKYYENPFAVPQGFTHTDPRWIGAWWIGFLVSGALMLLLAFPLSLFPREFKRRPKRPKMLVSTLDGAQLSAEISGQPKKETDDAGRVVSVNGSEYRAVQTDETEAGKLNSDRKHRKGEDDEDDQAEGQGKRRDLSLMEMPAEIYKIVSNPIIVCQMMGNLFRGIGIIGYFVFQTKYLEAQFRQSASKASLISGTTGFLAKIFGVLFGGLLITLIRPGPRTLTTYIFIVELTSVFTLLYGASVIGPQYLYPNTQLGAQDNQLNLLNQCNSACHCDHVRYQPVCDHHEMKAYFSPCHAGCKMAFKEADNFTSIYSQCDCADNSAKTLQKCPPDSERLIRYATIVALGGMISGSSRSGNMVTFFRSIQPEQKSLAVAVGSFWHSLMVAIPYPIIYGKIFDYSCLVWSFECGKRGNCWLYDTEKLRYIYHGVSIALIAMGSVFDFIMIFLSPRLGSLYDEEDTKKKSFKDKLTSMFGTKKSKNEHLDQTNLPIASTTTSDKDSKTAPMIPQELKVTKL